MLRVGSLEGEMEIGRTVWQEKTHGDRHDFLLKPQPFMHLSKDNFVLLNKWETFEVVKWNETFTFHLRAFGVELNLFCIMMWP